MSWEYDGLFNAWTNSDEPSLLPPTITDTRIGRMGYRTRTTKAGARLEAEVFPVFTRQAVGKARAAKKAMTPAAQEKANHARSIRRTILLAEENFTREDYFLTLTYRGAEPSYKRCKADVVNFLKRVKRERKTKGLEEQKSLYVIEGGEGRERIHIHMLLSGGLSWETLHRIWDRGRNSSGGMIQAARLETQDGKIEGAVLYMAKQLWAKGYRKQTTAEDEVSGIAGYMAQHPGSRRRWCPSKNLRQPKVRTSNTKVSNARVKRIAYDFQSEAKAVMEKIYPGYSFVRCSVYYSDVVDGVYIRCVMRRFGQ